MNFQNAQQGIKKIYNYEIIQIVIALIALLMTVVALAANEDLKTADVDMGTVGAGIVIILGAIAVIVLTIISIIILIKGLVLASKDEQGNFFKDAVFAAIILLIVSILSGLTSIVKFLGDHSSLINTILNVNTIFLFVSIVMGIRSFADKLGRKDITKLSVPVIVIIVAIQIFSATSNYVGDVMSVISAVLTLIGYIVYLVFLSKAKDMF